MASRVLDCSCCRPGQGRGGAGRLRGSDVQVTEGSGKALVLAVGEDSEWGRTMAMVMGQAGNTPLQEALTTLAAAIGKVGLSVGVLCFIVLFIRCAAACCRPEWAHCMPIQRQRSHSACSLAQCGCACNSSVELTCCPKPALPCNLI